MPVLFLDGSNDNTPMSQTSPTPPITIINLILFLFFVHFWISLVLLFGHFLSLYPTLFPFLFTSSCLFFANSFSNPLFLSFISSVENGISPNIHFASLSFLFCFRHPPSFPTFFLLSYTPCYFLTPYSLFLGIPQSSLIPSYPFVSLSHILFFSAVTPTFSFSFFLFSPLSLLLPFFFPSCRSSSHRLNLNIRLGFISMTFMVAKPFILVWPPPPLTASLKMSPFAHTHKRSAATYLQSHLISNLASDFLTFWSAFFIHQFLVGLTSSLSSHPFSFSPFKQSFNPLLNMCLSLLSFFSLFSFFFFSQQALRFH